MASPIVERQLGLISLADLQVLVEQSQREGVRLEYKRDLYEWNDAGTREFLADVSSFANAQGGLLLIGVDDEDGCAAAIPGVPVEADREIQRIVGKVQSGIEPRIANVEVGAIDVGDGRYVLALRIPHSWVRPHMVTFKNFARFFSRNSSGKYQLDVHELRSAFLGSDVVASRVREFRFGRISDLEAAVAPVVLEVGAKVVLHVLPYSSLEPGTTISIPELNSINEFMRPIYSSGWSWRHNFDGLLTYANPSHSEISTYVQLFRAGIIEAVDCRLLRPDDGGPSIPSIHFEQEVLDAVSRFKRLLEALQISPPIAWMITLVGVRGYNMATRRQLKHRIDRHVVAVPELIDESGATPYRLIAKQLVDPIWQACGWERSPNFDDDGNWQPRS